MRTYAREWRAAHEPAAQASGIATSPALAGFEPEQALTLAQLAAFLRNPVKAFFRKRLLVNFAGEQEENSDDECFAVDALHEYSLIRALLDRALAQGAQQDSVPRALLQLRKAGELPLKGLGDFKQQALQETLATMLHAWREAEARFPEKAERQSVRLQADEVVLEDWIDHLRASDVSGTRQIAWLELEPGKLLEGGTKPVARADKLSGPWIRSLAVAACGLSAQGVLVGRDGVVEINPVPEQQAKATLSMLLKLWLAGMNSPLPLPPKTALALLADKNPLSQYEGDYQLRGDVEEASLARVFPDYEALIADGRFELLSQQIYRAMLDWAACYVSATFHAGEKQEDEA